MRNGSSSPPVSVIVPVYNAEAYLDACIRSVCSQTWQDWELLLVDDGSTDRSLEICRQYAREDGRITVLPIAHAGHVRARNAGLAHASGEWITFLDADDLLAENALETLLANRENVDLVMGLFERIPPEETEPCREGGTYGTFADLGPAFARFYRPYFFISVWAKLYRRTVMGRGLPEEEKDFGVWLYNLEVLPRCRGIRLVPEIVYSYRRVPGSVSGRFRSRLPQTCRTIYETFGQTFSAFPEVRAFLARDYASRLVLYLAGLTALSISAPQKQVLLEAEMAEPFYRQAAIRSPELPEESLRIWRAFLAGDTEAVFRETEEFRKKLTL